MGRLKREHSAAAQVAQLRSWEPLEWWRIEACAWNDEPAVLGELRPHAPAPVRAMFTTGRPPLWSVVYIGVFLAATVAPAVAAFLLIRDFARASGEPLDIVPSAVLALVGAVVTVVDILAFAKAPAHEGAPGAARAVGAVHVVASAAALAVIAIVASGAGLVGSAAWAWAFAIDLAVGLVLILVIGRRRATRAPEPADLAAVDRVVGSVSAERRQAVRQDLDAAITELERRELIDGEAAIVARNAPLGRLGSTLVVSAIR